jgi:MFS family permease
VVLLSLLNAVALTDRMIFGALAPVLQPALQLSDVQLGLVQGPAFGVAYAVAMPFAGRLVDAVGGRRMLIWSVLLWTLGLIVSAAAGSVGILAVGRAITGVGQAVLTPAAFTLIIGTVAPDQAGRMIGLFTGAGTIGRGIAFAVGGALLAVLGNDAVIAPWSAVLLVLAVVNLLILALGSRYVARDRLLGRRDKAYAVLWRWLRASPRAIGLTVLAALGTVVIAQALGAWVSVVLVRSFAIGPAAAGLAIGAIGIIAGPLGHVLGGMGADSGWRRDRAFAGATLLCIPAILLFVEAATLPLAWLGLALTMLASGASAMLGLMRVQRMIPATARGSANGLFMAMVALVGISGGPALVGLAAAQGTSIGRGLVLVVITAALVSTLATLGAGSPAQDLA